MNLAYLEFGEPTLEVLCECAANELNDFENETIEIWDAVNNGFNTLYTAEQVYNTAPGDKNSNSKYSNGKIEEVFLILVQQPNISLVNVSELTNVSVLVIRSISRGLNHKWLQDKYPEEYNVLISLKGSRRSNSHSAEQRGINYPDILSPTGVTYKVTNAKLFATNNLLDPASFHKVLCGQRKTHKGWKLA